MSKKPLKDEHGQFVTKNGMVVFVDDEEKEAVVKNRPMGKVTHTR